MIGNIGNFDEKKLTLLCPIKDRPEFSKRFINYLIHVSCPFQVVIADGSIDNDMRETIELAQSHGLNIKYKKYPPDKTWGVYLDKMLDALENIQNAKSPKLQKQLGGAITTCDDWERTKFSTMTDICRHKFNQNPDLLKFLMETEQTYLCEDNPHCKVWGVGISRRHPDSDKVRDMPGNKMGKILMVLRQEHADAASQ